MNRWVTYIQERFSLAAYTILAAGLALSGIFLDGGAIESTPFLVSFAGVLLFLFQSTLMDELKDYEKDKIANPDNPLPRGLLEPEEVAKAIQVLGITMLLYGVFVAITLQILSALAYLAVVGMLWVVYREFYAADWLARRPIIRGACRQTVMIPVALFVTSVTWPHHPLSAETAPFCLVLMGAFFCYDTCSKLNPYAHPAMMTYIHFYGFHTTFLVATGSLLVSAIGAVGMGLGFVLGLTELCVFFSLLVLFLDRRLYQIPEKIAACSLIVHVWSGVIQKLGIFFILS